MSTGISLTLIEGLSTIQEITKIAINESKNKPDNFKTKYLPN